MKVETKYEVGHTFYVPRCYCVEEEETLVIGPATWSRTIERYEARVKHKVVSKIVVEIGGHLPEQIALTYYVKDVGADRTIPSRYGESEITSMTFDEAKAIADDHAARGEVLFR